MHSRSSVVARTLAATVGALAFLIMAGAAATAHSQLTGSEPEAGTSVESPTEVVLTFNEALLTLGSQLTLTDAGGAIHELEPRYPQPHIAAADLPDLPAGAVSLAWRVVSADGHPIEGVLEFVILPSVEPSSTPTSPTATPTVTASPSTSPSASAPPIPANVPMPEQSGGVPPWLWAALGLSVAGATGIAVWSARKR